jgi:hypothetical protein
MFTRIAFVWAVVATVLLAVVLVGALRELSDTPGQTKSLQGPAPNCHPATSTQAGPYQGEGWQGFYRSCAHLHGEFRAWSEHGVAVEGTYIYGKRHGKFTYFRPDGTVDRTVHYDMEREVSAPADEG